MQTIKWHKIIPTHPDTIFIVGSGPSVKNFNFEVLKEKGYIIAVNDMGKYIPFADAWFTLDPWGLTGPQIPKGFKGKLYAAVPEYFGTPLAVHSSHKKMPFRKINYLCRIGMNVKEYNINNYILEWGLNEDPRCINSGNSGFGALNLAYHMRPKKIILMGIDGSKGYFFDEKRNTNSLKHLPYLFQSSVKQLENKNINVINASPKSTVKCFKKDTIYSLIFKDEHRNRKK